MHLVKICYKASLSYQKLLVFEENVNVEFIRGWKLKNDKVFAKYSECVFMIKYSMTTVIHNW